MSSRLLPFSRKENEYVRSLVLAALHIFPDTLIYINRKLYGEGNLLMCIP